MRKDVLKTKWDLSPLFKSDDDPKMNEKRKEVEENSYKFINKWKNRTDYLENPEILREALDEYEEWDRLYGTGGDEEYYFWLRTSQDQNDPALKAKYNKIIDFAKKIRTDIQFFTLSLGKIEEKKRSLFLQHPQLEKYKHFLERIFEWAEYQLADEEEKILSLVSKTSEENWIDMVAGFISKEEREILVSEKKKEVKNFSEIASILDNPNKKVRDDAARAFNEIVAKHAEVAEAELNSVLEFNKTVDNLRKTPRADFTRHFSDDIESKVVDVLIETVVSRFSVAKRYYALKAKLFGFPKLAYHERNISYGESNKEYSYEESVNLVGNVLGELDKDFSDIFRGFTNGKIDVFPAKGKSGGGFCVGRLHSQPTYILLNHMGRVRDVRTLAHEAGHGINNELVKKKHHAIYFGTPLSTAEVASTFMEDFVFQKLEEEADDETKLSLLMTKLNEDVSTIFRQAACYRFEQELHKDFRERGYLSKEEIGTLFQKHMNAYMGEAVEQSSGSENWWVYWSHIRRIFYVYSYASGLLISKSLQASVKKDKKFIGKVKEFLSVGTSASPKEIFLELGIDITKKDFWNKGIDEVETLLEETEKLAKKLGKI